MHLHSNRPPIVGQEVPASSLSHLICIADDCLAANCDEGAKAAAEAAIMAPRARENFIFSVGFDGKEMKRRANQAHVHSMVGL